MAKGRSQQHEIDKKRPPRVHITYDVEIGGAKEIKEIPFVVGVMADLSGQPAEPLPKLKDRKFVEIDRDNFDKVLNKTAPRLAMKVDNQLQKDGTKLGVELKFRELADFDPENLAKQVKPLRELLDARQRLSDLKNKVIANDKLDDLLQQIMKSTESLKRLEAETRPAPESPEQED